MESEVELCVEVGSNIGDTWVENADINQLCRSCANTHDNMIPIFEGDGLEHDLQNKIDKHFPVNISRDDGLPHQMCYQCASTLVAWHDMYMGCIDAENKLKNLLKKSTAKGQVEKTVAGSSIASAVSASVEPDSQQKMASEMEVDNDDNDDDDDDDVPEHGGDDNDDEEDDDDDNDDEDEEVEEIVLHKLEAKAKEKNVEVNEKGTTIRDQEKVVSIEVRPTTSILQRISRLIASADSADKKDLGIINRREKWVRDECEVCGKCFTSRHALSEHRRIHSGEKPYVCDECGKAFRTSATLYTHNKSHSDVRPYICEICRRGFKCNQQLQRHISIHTGERNFVCNVCSKDFRLKNDLSSHMAIHNNTLSYNCDTCAKQFRSNATLKRHLPLHDDTKAYMCPMCPMATFHHKRYLGNHLRLKHKVTLTEIVKRGETIEAPLTEFYTNDIIL